jgi:hypothetical protein
LVEGWSLDRILREMASLGDPCLSGRQRSVQDAGVLAVASEARGLVKAARELFRLPVVRVLA